jgi:hypothetical protein
MRRWLLFAWVLCGLSCVQAQTSALTRQFQQVRDAVVTVWSEFGSGSGFIVDNRGLIVTNDHVVAGARWVAVQFDPTRKVRALVLSEDAVRDVAVLRADITAFPGAHAVELATPAEVAGVQPGAPVFTVGSPLHQRRVLTAGIVSGIEPHAFLSDLDLNHGNSGGPLFDAEGRVIGITTFLDAGQPNGAGLSGIVKIGEALPALQRARAAMAAEPRRQAIDPPSAELLPVAPAGAYPLTALQQVMRLRSFDLRPYQMSLGGYEVMISTPVVTAWLQSHRAAGVAQARARRTGQPAEAAFDPAADLRAWMQYTGEFQPLVEIVATPRLKPTFLSRLGRSLDRRRTALHYRFAADFDRMELRCDGEPVAPITPGRIPATARFSTPDAEGLDAVFEGIYQYGPSAIAPRCAAMELVIYSADGKSARKRLDPRLVERVWQSFAPWRAAQAMAGQ